MKPDGRRYGTLCQTAGVTLLRVEWRGELEAWSNQAPGSSIDSGLEAKYRTYDRDPWSLEKVVSR